MHVRRGKHEQVRALRVVRYEERLASVEMWTDGFDQGKFRSIKLETNHCVSEGLINARS